MGLQTSHRDPDTITATFIYFSDLYNPFRPFKEHEKTIKIDVNEHCELLDCRTLKEMRKMIFP